MKMNPRRVEGEYTESKRRSLMRVSPVNAFTVYISSSGPSYDGSSFRRLILGFVHSSSAGFEC